MHYVRPSFTVALLSERNFSWSSRYSISLPGDNGFFSCRGYNDWQFWACWLGGITAADWHSGRPGHPIWFILPSCHVTLFWLRVKFFIITCPSLDVRLEVGSLWRCCLLLVKMWCNTMTHHTVKPRPEAHMDVILFEVLLKSIDLIPQQQILQKHYLYYR